MLLNFFKDGISLQSLDKLEQTCVEIANEFKEAHKKGNSILLAGNGGSCSDSLHFAGELSCTYARLTANLSGRSVCKLIRLL